MVKKIEQIVEPSKGLEPTEHTTTELPPDTPTKILQGQNEIKFTLESMLPSLERNFDIMNALAKGINDLESSLNHKVASLKVDLLEKIDTLREELLKKTNVDPSTLNETTTETNSTTEIYENVDTTEQGLDVEHNCGRLNLTWCLASSRVLHEIIPLLLMTLTSKRFYLLKKP